MCPTTESVNTYILRIHILTDIINLRGESVLTRNPDTGLARMSFSKLSTLRFLVRVEKNLKFAREGIRYGPSSTH